MRVAHALSIDLTLVQRQLPSQLGTAKKSRPFELRSDRRDTRGSCCPRANTTFVAEPTPPLPMMPIRDFRRCVV